MHNSIFGGSKALGTIEWCPWFPEIIHYRCNAIRITIMHSGMQCNVRSHLLVVTCQAVVVLVSGRRDDFPCFEDRLETPFSLSLTIALSPRFHIWSVDAAPCLDDVILMPWKHHTRWSATRCRQQDGPRTIWQNGLVQYEQITVTVNANRFNIHSSEDFKQTLKTRSAVVPLLPSIGAISALNWTCRRFLMINQRKKYGWLKCEWNWGQNIQMLSLIVMWRRRQIWITEFCLFFISGESHPLSSLRSIFFFSLSFFLSFATISAFSSSTYWTLPCWIPIKHRREK